MEAMVLGVVLRSIAARHGQMKKFLDSGTQNLSPDQTEQTAK